MKSRLISKGDLAGFLDDLLETRQVYAPVEQGGLTGFESIREGSQVTLSNQNSHRPLKDIFFPCSETLFTYEGDEVTAVPVVDQQRVIVGVRPCDAKSLNLLDNVFDDPDCPDPYYVSRRRNTLLIGLACNHPLSTCFCAAVGGGPFSDADLDLLLTDLGHEYLVESVSEQGEALVANSGHFRPSTPGAEAEKAEIAAQAAEEVQGPQLTGIKEKLDTLYESPYWDELQEKCLACGACSYLCPTCHCFDIEDETVKGQGRRVRNWDTCQFSLFTLHASGHNPRPSGKERMRQRVMHKFRYFVENHGEVACVGCGRCVRECPVNQDVRVVIEEIMAI